MEYIKLNNGVQMPCQGYGVFQMSEKECEECVGWAFEAGYRLIDTAEAYRNEAAVGRAIWNAGIPREEIFVTTKVRQNGPGDMTRDAFQRSLEKLGLDYIDLYLIHQPYGDIYSTWRAMERLYRDGLVHAIGVSNFNKVQLTDLMVNNEIAPMVNQIEVNPFVQRKEDVEYIRANNAWPMAWGPLAQGKDALYANKLLGEMAGRYGKTIPQIVLRWLFQRNIVALPKTSHMGRMKENMDIFDFALTDADMQRLEKLDNSNRKDIHDDPEFVKILCRDWDIKGRTGE